MTSSIMWGETEIKLLYDKVAEYDQKFANFSEIQNVVELLIGRVDLLEGKLNMMRRDIDLCEPRRSIWKNNPGEANLDRFRSLQGEFDDSGWENAEMMVTEPSLSAIKQERAYDYEDVLVQNDDDWQLIDSDYEYDPNDTHPGRPKQRPSKKLARSEPRRRVRQPTTIKQSIPTDNLSVKPNTRLIEKTKALLGSIERDETTLKYPCPLCTKQYNHKKDLVRHHYVHSGLKPYQCTECPEAFTRGDKLTKHIKSFHSSSIDELGDGSVTEGLKKSYCGQAIPKSLTCKLCDTKQLFLRADKLAEHYTRVHITPNGVKPTSKESSHPCSVCGKKFRSSYDLARHLAIHSADRESFLCNICQTSYTRRDKLTAHQKQKHFVSTEISIDDCDDEVGTTTVAVLYDCPDCSKMFAQKSRLDRHLIACRGLKPFHCDECGRNFTQKSSLIQHRACVHQKIKRFLCSDCGQCFYGSTNYKKHVRSHRGIKPYPCKICGRCFNGQGDLKMHERIHSGVRNIQCPLCELKFYRPYTLKRHMLVHTGEKPYMCDTCGASFSQSGSLKKHKECHDRGGISGAKKKMYEDHRKIRIEKKPRESRLLRQMMVSKTDSEVHQRTSEESLVNPSRNIILGHLEGEIKSSSILINPYSNEEQQLFHQPNDPVVSSIDFLSGFPHKYDGF